MIETLNDLRPLFEQPGIEGDWWRWAMPAIAQRVSGWNPAWLTTTEQILINPTYVSQVALSALYDRRRDLLQGNPGLHEQVDEWVTSEVNHAIRDIESMCSPDPKEEIMLMAPTATKTKPAKPSNPSLRKAAEKSGIGFYGDPSKIIESLAPAEVVRVEKISASEIDTETIICGIDMIRPSPDNPRQNYDPEFLQKLGKSIEENGQLSPVLVLPKGEDSKFEIIDGETRWRAAQAVGLQTLECRVVNCTPAEAAALRLITANERNPLNAIEEARGLQILMEKHGWSQRTVEAKIGMSQGQVSNRTRLLKLPKAWQERVISGEISATQARELAPWIEYPKVLVHLEKAFERDRKHTKSNWSRAVLSAAEEASRPLSGHFYMYQNMGNKLAFKWEKHKDELQVVKVDGENRAFNVNLWSHLQSQGLKEQKAREATKAENEKARIKSDPKLSAAQQKEKTKKLQEQFAKKLWRHKCAWLQQRIVERIPKLPNSHIVQLLLLFSVNSRAGRRDAVYDEVRGKKKTSWGSGLSQGERAQDIFSMELEGSLLVARLCLARFLQGPFESYESDTPSELILAVAEWLQVDPVTEWKNSEEFLELHTSDQLRQLAAEWKLKSNGLTSPDKMKRSELIQWLRIDGEKAKCPKEFLEQKVVRL